MPAELKDINFSTDDTAQCAMPTAEQTHETDVIASVF